MSTHPSPQASARRRPSVWWFSLPVLLLVASALSFGLLLWGSVQSGLRTDAEVPLDGRPHEVSVPADEERTVFVARRDADPACRFVDAASGEELDLGAVSGTFTRSNGQDEWRALWTLAPSSGTVLATCEGEGTTPVQLAPPVDVGRFVGGIMAAVLVPMALGGLALLSLVVLGVLFLTRRGPRVHPATPPPPGPH